MKRVHGKYAGMIEVTDVPWRASSYRDCREPDPQEVQVLHVDRRLEIEVEQTGGLRGASAYDSCSA